MLNNEFEKMDRQTGRLIETDRQMDRQMLQDKRNMLYEFLNIF